MNQDVPIIIVACDYDCDRDCDASRWLKIQDSLVFTLVLFFVGL